MFFEQLFSAIVGVIEGFFSDALVPFLNDLLGQIFPNL